MKKEMTLQEALEHSFLDEQPDRLENRKWFDNKEAADTFSESKKHLWPEGKGLVYGPFTNPKINGGEYWYEVSY